MRSLRRRWIAGTLMFAVLAVVPWYLWQHTAKHEAGSVGPIATQAGGPPTRGGAGGGAGATAPDDSSLLAGSNKVRALYQAAVDAAGDVSFTGRVVDQRKAPVVGAVVTFDAGGNYFGRKSGTAVVRTDEHGIFKIRGAVGAVLVLMSMTAPGYEISLLDQQRDYTRSGDSYTRMAAWEKCVTAHPCGFQAWRYLEGRQPALYRRSEGGNVPPGGVPRYLNLYEPGSYVLNDGSSNAQIQLGLTPMGAQVARAKQPWRFVIHAIDGGLLEATGLYTNEAPEDDYLKEVTISGQGQVSGERHQFYLKIDSRKAYARLTLRLFYSGLVSDGMGVGFDYSINEEGGRVLDTFDSSVVKPRGSSLGR